MTHRRTRLWHHAEIKASRTGASDPDGPWSESPRQVSSLGHFLRPDREDHGAVQPRGIGPWNRVPFDMLNGTGVFAGLGIARHTSVVASRRRIVAGGFIPRNSVNTGASRSDGAPRDPCIVPTGRAGADLAVATQAFLLVRQLDTDFGQTELGIWHGGAAYTQQDTPEPGMTALNLDPCGTVASGLEVVLPLVGEVSGTVQFRDMPIATVVRIYSEDGRFLGEVRSEDDGTYRSFRLPAGPHYLLARAGFGIGEIAEWHGGAPVGAVPDPVADGAVPVQIQAGATATNIHFDIEDLDLGQLVVRVQDEFSNSAPATVEVWGPDSFGRIRLLSQRTTQEIPWPFPDGPRLHTVVLAASVSKPLYVKARPASTALAEVWHSGMEVVEDDPVLDGATVVQVSTGEATQIDFVLEREPVVPPTPVAKVTGLILDATNGPVDLVRVVLVNALGTVLDSAQSRSNGRYTLTTKSNGTVFVRTDDDDYWMEWHADVPAAHPADPMRDGALAIDVVPNGCVSNIDLRVRERAWIYGTVTDAAGGLFGEVEVLRDGEPFDLVLTDPFGRFSYFTPTVGQFALRSRSIWHPNVAVTGDDPGADGATLLDPAAGAEVFAPITVGGMLPFDLRVEGLGIAGPVLEFTTRNGAVYRVLRLDKLLEGDWMLLGTETGVGASMLYDLPPLEGDSGFFRVEEEAGANP